MGYILYILSKTIGNFPTVLSFIWLFLKLNRFICNELPVLPDQCTEEAEIVGNSLLHSLTIQISEGGRDNREGVWEISEGDIKVIYAMEVSATKRIEEALFILAPFVGNIDRSNTVD